MALHHVLDPSGVGPEAREAEYLRYVQDLARARLRLTSAVLLLVLPLGALVSHFTQIPERWEVFLVRAAVLLVAAGAWAYARRRSSRPHALRIGVVLSLGVALVLELQVLRTGGSGSPYGPGLLLLLIGSGLLFPFTWRQAAGLSAAICAISAAPLVVLPRGARSGHLAVDALFMVCAVLIVVFGAKAASGRRRREVMAQLALAEEQRRSERLLFNILPAAIVERLKREHHSLADGFSEATILFADIVGFTQLSQEVPPHELVRLLNEVFSKFDALVDKHGLEKIKTIGDAYMVVGGLPTPRDDHAEAVADMALDMRRAVAELSLPGGRTLEIRIGINTGPVVAGVIGTKKFIYDLWGDAVNTASRMESHGEPGAIQVTEDTYERLRDDFVLEPRGKVHIKGKGEMETYLLLGRRGSEG